MFTLIIRHAGNMDDNSRYYYKRKKWLSFTSSAILMG
jgi:hypothetical protein